MKEVTNENVTVEAEVNENQETVVEETEKKGLIAKFKGLKTWQKVGIITVGCVGLGLGSKAIFDLVSTNPEIVTEVGETVAEEVVNQ